MDCLSSPVYFIIHLIKKSVLTTSTNLVKMDNPEEISERYESNGAEEFEQKAQKALLERPQVSIRVRLMLGFLLFFVLTGAMIISAYIILDRLHSKTEYLVIVDRYTHEIQQARRFEKNYFLYGTNLTDIVEHANACQSLVNSSTAELESLVGKNNLDIMTGHLVRYLELLGQLSSLDSERPPQELPEHPAIEAELREHGSLMVSFALELSDKERKSVRNMFKIAKRIPWIFLGFLLILAIYEANFISRQMISRLTRLMNLTKRIAEGDFTPIMPERKYRDEFSNVNIALNSMMHELNHRQEIMIQSHKLRAVGTLTAGIAHELNNPINNITLTASMLSEDYSNLSDEERLDMVKDLVEQAERSEKIVRNLLDFARESEITTEHLNLSQLLEETLKFVSNQIKLRKVKVEFEPADNLPEIHGDRQQLSQVFLNLILNSLDAMKPGGKLTIVISRAKTQGFMETKFRDNGAGIPSHILPNIFDPFFTTKPTGKGTGLGLSVSLGIVRKHGGDVLVESALGWGTEFTVLLPIAEVPASIEGH